MREPQDSLFYKDMQRTRTSEALAAKDLECRVPRGQSERIDPCVGRNHCASDGELPPASCASETAGLLPCQRKAKDTFQMNLQFAKYKNFSPGWGGSVD